MIRARPTFDVLKTHPYHSFYEPVGIRELNEPINNRGPILSPGMISEWYIEYQNDTKQLAKCSYKYSDGRGHSVFWILMEQGSFIPFSTRDLVDNELDKIYATS